MQRLTLTEFTITIGMLVVLAFGASRLFQGWLLQVQAETTSRMEAIK